MSDGIGRVIYKMARTLEPYIPNKPQIGRSRIKGDLGHSPGQFHFLLNIKTRIRLFIY